MGAGAGAQSFRWFIERFEAESKSAIVHRHQGFGAQLDERLHSFFRVHVHFAARRWVVGADRQQRDVDLVPLPDFLEPREISAVAAVKNRSSIHRDDESAETAVT